MPPLFGIPRWLILLCLAILSASGGIFTAAAEDCPKPSVAFQQGTVSVPEADRANPEAQAARARVESELKSLNEAVAQHLLEGAQGSVRFSDSGVLRSRVGEGENQIEEPAAPCEVGFVFSSQVIATSDASAPEGWRYSARAWVQDPQRKTEVMAATRQFNSTHEVSVVAEQLADELMPLLPRLRKYQRQVREKEGNAIHAMISIEPKRMTLRPGEQQQLRIWLLDCDGGKSPLTGRDVTFLLEGPGNLYLTSVGTGEIDTSARTRPPEQVGRDVSGRSSRGLPGDKDVLPVPPTTVQTNDEGRAEALFTAREQGVATITVVYRYRSISGCFETVETQARIDILQGGWPGETLPRIKIPFPRR